MKRKMIAVGICMFLGAVQPTLAAEQEELEIVRQTTVNLIYALVEKGVLTQEAANDLIKQAEKSARKKVADTQAANSKVVRVPYVPESVKREIRDQVKQEVVAQAKAERWGDVNAVPEWVDRMHWEGDLRVRYQQDRYATGNDLPAQFDVFYGFPTGTTTNTSENRDRYRLRARLGLTAKISSMVSAGVRIVTGNNSDPVSTNQTLGNNEQKYSLWLDQAYLKLEPTEWLSALGGRMPNPWFHTDLVWDADLNFDGFAANARYRFDERRSVYLTAGVFPIQDVAPSTTVKAKSKWLYGVQAGADVTALSGSKARFGVALYDYRNVEGIPDTAVGLLDYTATQPQSRQKGNSVFREGVTDVYKLSSKFKELNLTAQLDIANFDPTHVILTADYVRNIGFDEDEIRQRTNLASTNTVYNKKTLGYQLQATVGRPKIQDRGDWQASIGYRYLERDAVLDAFTDSDFRLGGTDNKGYFLGGQYGLDRNTWLSLKWMSADGISALRYGVDVFQLDLNARF